MATSIRHRIEQLEALIAEKEANYERALTSAKEATQKVKKEVHGTTPQNRAGLKGKKEYLNMKVDALQNAADEVLNAKDRLIELLNEATREDFQKMRGLLAYGFSIGQTTPDCQLLHDSLTDFLESKSGADRQAAERAVNLILRHGNLGDKNDKAGADNEVLRRFESLSGEERTAYYQAHRVEIMKAQDARQSNP